MLKFLRDKTSDRKFRLFALACCRRIDRHITDPRSQAAVRHAEVLAEAERKGKRGSPSILAGARLAFQVLEGRFGDSTGGEEYFQFQLECSAAQTAYCALERRAYEAALYCSGYAATTVGWTTVGTVRPGQVPAEFEPTVDQEQAVQAGLLRDIVGNPFRPPCIDPDCLTLTVRQLAQAAYDERQLPEGTLDPSRLAVLADALEEAGCTSGEILSHLRGPGPHVRGCWCLDLVLGRGEP